MKIACNYYRETEQLVDAGQIEIDYFKFPSLGYQMKIMEDIGGFERFAEEISQKKPILLHGLYPAPHDLGMPGLRECFDFDTADRMIRAAKTPGLSFHPMLQMPDKTVPIRNTLNMIIENAVFIRERSRNWILWRWKTSTISNGAS